MSTESVSNCENKPITEIALYLVRYAGSLDQFSCLSMKETVNSTLAHQRKHRGKTKKRKSVGMYDRFPVRSAVTFPRQFMKGVYE